MIEKMSVCWKELFLIAVVFGLFAFFVGDVSALAVGGVSGEITGYVGQNVDESFAIQNVLGDAVDVVMEGVVEQGSDVFSFSGDGRVSIPAGEIVRVPFTVTIPSDAVVGQEYPVSVLFRTVSSGGTGSGDGAQFTTNLRKGFTVRVIEETEEVVVVQDEPKERSNFWLWVLAIVIVIIIIWLVMKRKK